MKKAILLVSAVLVSNTSFAESHAKWGCSGEGAPENWATLTGDNFACTGKNQSPIDLSNQS